MLLVVLDAPDDVQATSEEVMAIPKGCCYNRSWRPVVGCQWSIARKSWSPLASRSRHLRYEELRL